MNLLANPELTDRLAAAYALGTLRGGARRRFEAIARRSPAVRAQVIIWQERFAGMTELQPAQVPSPNVWKRIENLLHSEPAASGEPALLERVRRQLLLWRGAALAGAVAAVAAVVVGVQLSGSLQREEAVLADAHRQRDQLTRQTAELSAQLQAKPAIQYVAVLADDRQAPSMLVTFDPSHNTLTLKRVARIEEGPDRSLQLWALPPGERPRSLGVIGDGAVVKLNAVESQVKETPALAVSLEPLGGAPQGSGPTGPVLFKGALLRTTL